MREIVETAQRLREVRRAYRRFLALSAMEMAARDPLDRLAEDVERLPAPPPEAVVDRRDRLFARDELFGDGTR